MDTIANLRAFIEVAHAGSFSRAARTLGLATSVLTKRVDQLEWRTRAKLFERSTRKLTLTDEGRRLLPAAQRIVHDVADALGSLHGQAQQLEGHLRIKVPTTLSVFHLADVLARFQHAHPSVSLDVVVIDRPVNPLQEGFDIVVGMLPSSFDGVAEVGLSPLERMAVAAPSYLEQHGTPQHPTDLVRHRLLNFQPTGSSWVFNGPHGPITVDLAPHLSTNDGHALLRGAIAGNGITVLSSYMAGAALESGQLQRVLEDFPIPEFWVRALVPNARLHLGRVQALLSALQQAFTPEAGWR